MDEATKAYEVKNDQRMGIAFEVAGVVTTDEVKAVHALVKGMLEQSSDYELYEEDEIDRSYGILDFAYAEAESMVFPDIDLNASISCAVTSTSYLCIGDTLTHLSSGDQEQLV